MNRKNNFELMAKYVCLLNYLTENGGEVIRNGCLYLEENFEIELDLTKEYDPRASTKINRFYYSGEEILNLHRLNLIDFSNNCGLTKLYVKKRGIGLLSYHIRKGNITG